MYKTWNAQNPQPVFPLHQLFVICYGWDLFLYCVFLCFLGFLFRHIDSFHWRRKKTEEVETWVGDWPASHCPPPAHSPGSPENSLFSSPDPAKLFLCHNNLRSASFLCNNTEDKRSAYGPSRRSPQRYHVVNTHVAQPNSFFEVCDFYQICVPEKCWVSKFKLPTCNWTQWNPGSWSWFKMHMIISLIYLFRDMSTNTKSTI